MNKLFITKSFNIIAGSAMGIAAGLVIYLMLKFVGADFGSLETSLIIGLPSILGTVTSLVIF